MKLANEYGGKSMSDRRHFLRLLKAEIADTIEDLTLVGERYRQRYEKSEIGSYVFQENSATLQRELDALENFNTIVDGIDPSVYKGISEMTDSLLARSRELVASHEDPEVIFLLLKRKMDKILHYLSEG
ncbi:MAG TPA: hypothetical protein PLC54_02815 [Spirochaetales bacterium]|nr:hypothetical protein [Spirochaetales bacterium]